MTNSPVCNNSWNGWYRFLNNRGFYNYLTLNAKTAGQSTNAATWRPNLPYPGKWRVEMYNSAHAAYVWPCLGRALAADTSNAVYKIFYSGGETQVSINQQPGGGTWVSLGSYSFSDGSNGYVSLSDLTGETFTTKYVLFSALRFIYVGPE